jgi:hemoglobin/transferrin/lactoferrin receptor protein
VTRVRPAEWYYGPSKWFMVMLKFKKGNGKFYDGLKLGFAYQYFEESRATEILRCGLTQQWKSDALNLNNDLENKKMG